MLVLVLKNPKEQCKVLRKGLMENEVSADSSPKQMVCSDSPLASKTRGIC